MMTKEHLTNDSEYVELGSEYIISSVKAVVQLYIMN